MYINKIVINDWQVASEMIKYSCGCWRAADNTIQACIIRSVFEVNTDVNLLDDSHAGWISKGGCPEIQPDRWNDSRPSVQDWNPPLLQRRKQNDGFWSPANMAEPGSGIRWEVSSRELSFTFCKAEVPDRCAWAENPGAAEQNPGDWRQGCSYNVHTTWEANWKAFLPLLQSCLRVRWTLIAVKFLSPAVMSQPVRTDEFHRYHVMEAAPLQNVRGILKGASPRLHCPGDKENG